MYDKGRAHVVQHTNAISPLQGLGPQLARKRRGPKRSKPLSKCYSRGNYVEHDA